MTTANRFGNEIPQCEITRVTTIGSDVTISDNPATLVAIFGEQASTSIVTLKDGPNTVAALAVGAIPLAGGVNFYGARFENSLIVNVAVTGVNLLVLWNPK